MTPEELREYDERQARIVLDHSDVVLSRGYVEDSGDLYPDIEAPEQVAYLRTPAPLALLVLMYEKTVVFQPPMTQQEVESRWQTPIDTMISLAEASLVQPIIGNPVDYTAEHFERLLATRPPSVWSRGLALLNRLGMGDTLDKRHCPLPITDMARLPTMQVKYGTYFPHLSEEHLTQRIERELLTNYADLWIFGEGDLADSLSQLGGPQATVDRLVLANEIRTYPSLFGLDGTANYDSRFLRLEGATHNAVKISATHNLSKAVPIRGLELLYRGIGLTVSEMSAQDIIDFHVSGNAKRLRNAMRHFERSTDKIRSSSEAEGDDLLQLSERSIELEEILITVSKDLLAPGFNRSNKRVNQASELLFRAGSPAIGGWLTHMAGGTIIEGVAGGAVLQQLLVKRATNLLNDAAMRLRFNPGLANLWQIRGSLETAKAKEPEDED